MSFLLFLVGDGYDKNRNDKSIQKHNDFDFLKQILENVDKIIFIFSFLQCLDFFFHLQHFIFLER